MVFDKLSHQREGEAVGGDKFGFQDGVVVKGLSLAGTRKTMRTVAATETDRACSIDGHDEVDPQQAIIVEDLLTNEGFGHSGHDRLNLIGIQIRKGRIQSVAMGKTLHAKERLEFMDRRTVSKQQTKLPSCFEVKKVHRDTGERKTCEGVNNLEGISGVGDVGKQRGKTTKEMADGTRQSTN
ncbi:MAG: hypothetical protein ACOYOS_05670 [Syntrophales bacterium]